MAKATTNNKRTKPITVKKQPPSKDLPMSYYIGQSKKITPQKDRNGDIIPS